VVTMREALDRGKLAIEELDPADVNRARFVNKSAGHDLLDGWRGHHRRAAEPHAG